MNESCFVMAVAVLRSRLDGDVRVAPAYLEWVFSGCLDDAGVAINQDFDPRGHDATGWDNPGL